MATQEQRCNYCSDMVALNASTNAPQILIVLAVIVTTSSAKALMNATKVILGVLFLSWEIEDLA